MAASFVPDSLWRQLGQAPSLTIRNVTISFFVLPLLYVSLQVIYYLYPSPLAGYLGHKLWAISRLPWNRANMKSRIGWKICELHDKYGPVALDGRGIAPASIGGQRSLMTEHQDRHLRLRRAIDPAFSQRALREQESYFQDHPDNLVQKLKQQCKDGPLDMTTWFKFIAFDIVSDLTFGEPSGCVNNPDQPWIQAVFASAKAIVWFRLAVQYVTESRKKHTVLTEAKPKVRVKAKNPSKDFMSCILENDEKLNHLELVMLSSNSIVAGSSTSAGGMSGLAYLLLRNPDKLEKLKQETCGLFKSRADMTLQAANSCKYLRAYLNERMRLYPPTSGSLPRFVPGKGEMIKGNCVPGGYAVVVNQLAAGHSELDFKTAHEFHPQRWIHEPDSEFKDDDRSAVQRFSHGQRACIGRSMTYAEMSLTMAKFVRYFDWELDDPENLYWNSQGTYSVWEKLPLQVKQTPVSDVIE
ncbi:hypothetical protein G6011_05434 [Alternaria panax]|uniref:Cytochrome P450 monooxygenase n=1 Tax=Alternaria panax TaxID=48097 RepID=A0AAD4FES7_9PLEO|nr:hypothetical protein G6011_05434 [Alternaria panax]